VVGIAGKYFREASTGHVHSRTLAAVAERFLEDGCSLITSLIRMKRKRRTGESLSLVSVKCQQQVCHCRLFVVECCLVTYCICADCHMLAVGYGCRLSLSFIATGC
jgi:hypothetical protein